MHKLARLSLPLPTPRQLTLPVPFDPPEALTSPTMRTPAPALTMTVQQIWATVQQIWATLSPTAQAQLRQTLLRILQEVLHVAPES